MARQILFTVVGGALIVLTLVILAVVGMAIQEIWSIDPWPWPPLVASIIFGAATLLATFLALFVMLSIGRSVVETVEARAADD